MCRLLAELTKTDVRLMSETIRRLEQKAGSPNVDIRLTADIHAQIHLKIRALGLDPHDTSEQELYVALQNLAAVHENFLKKKFGIVGQIAPEDFAKRVEQIYSRLRFNRRSWLIRPAAVRRIMREQIPKQLVKVLGYRTADSMIKREPADVLLFLALQVESNTWKQGLDRQLQKLTAIDFEERLLEVKKLDETRYLAISEQLIKQNHSFVFGAPLIGTIFILSTKASIRPGLLLLTIMMAIKEATELQYLHSYLRHYQMEGSFAAKLPKALHLREKHSISVSGQNFDWNLLHRHYGSGSATKHPELFQPHLQAEDLAYRRAEEVLYRLEPALHFWHGAEYVGLNTTYGLISFNLLAVLVNLVNGLPINHQQSSHLNQAVWDEMLLRYLRHPDIEQAVLSGLSARDTYAEHAVKDVEFL
jgi:hypothetical protein